MMQAVRTTGFFSALLLSLSCFAGGAESKLIRYEVNGQIYTYSSNNNRQVEHARRHMEAARLADQAKAQAAERAANPLAKLLSWRPEGEVVQPPVKQPRAAMQAEVPAARTLARRREVRQEEHRVQPRRRVVALAPRRQQVAERVSSPRAVSRTASPDRTGSLGTQPSSDSQMVKEPVDPQAYMMAFVEKVRGKARPEPELQKPREP